jgi:hypothetical protein
MPLTRLDNLISSKTGRYLYVSPDDFNASDELDNRGNSPNRPFKTIQRAFIEVARYSYLPGIDNDRFDEFTIMLMPGDHYIDNRPGPANNSTTPVFSFDQSNNAWTDSSLLDLSNPNNVLYQFNGTEGGCVVPRGCSLVGYDLRRTIIRPLYVPDPADKEQARTSMFNVTGGAYIWQFTIKDGDLTTKSPLYDSNTGVGKVYYRKDDSANLAIPEFSHHKITVFEYAQKTELEIYYEKIAKAFAEYQPTIDDANEFGAKIQETRIVGPLSDLRTIDSIRVTDSSPAGTVTVQVTTKIAHGYIEGQYVAIQENGLDDALNGTFDVTALDTTNRRVFEFELTGTVAGLGLQNNQTYTTGNGLSTNAYVQAEVDSVESASPYMFNLSIRSTWGICGLWANGAKASGFKSMVCAQYTGVSLQKDDRAFIRYDRFTNTWNQASLSDAFATTPYHTKGDAYWKDDWRNFHIRASNDSFVQCVSIFAVGFADHFLMESGGDMSITNSNSNFGNTSLHAIGHKGYSFNQDKGGYISDIIPPERLVESSANEEEVDYYTWDVQASRGTNTKLYFAGTGITDPKKRPAATINGYRIGAKSNDKIYVELDPYAAGSGRTTPTDAIFNATLEPSGFISYPSSMQILNPTTVVVDNKNQDAANRIEDNKDLIAEEAYGYITTKYPALLTKNITITKCKRDIGYLLDAIIGDLRLGGNINSVQAAEAYFTGGQLNYIDGEKFETIEGFEYARDLAIAAMRNWDFLQTGCTVTNGSAFVTVPTTVGLSIGMKVEEYTVVNSNNTTVDTNSLTTSNIPANTYIRNIVNSTTIELGSVVNGVRAYLTTGQAVNAIGTNSNAKILFKLEDDNGDRKGIWSSEEGTVDTTITQDTVYPECATTASAIQSLFGQVKTILNNGINPVGDRFADASDLLLANKNYIADVAVKDMEIQYPNFNVPGGSVNCFDDVVDVVEAIAYNVKYGSNNQVYDAANLYVTGAHVAGEEEQSVYVFDKALEIATAVIQNIVYNPRAGLTTTYTQTRDLTITVDPNPVGGQYCADVISAMTTLFNLIEAGIDNAGTVYPANAGVFAGTTKSSPQQTVVARQNPTTSTSQFANRATLFTVNAGGTNPHRFETGTPVRLVARAKAGTTPDERDIRLPVGFQPNRTYFVIAPGRDTQPFNYNQASVYSGIFDGGDQTKLMLANTKENAAAGIYIYSPETEAIDDDVEILIQQYVLDETYNLHEYRVTFDGSSGTVLKTDVAHIFDKPTTGLGADYIQKVFFRAEGSDGQVGTLPTLSGIGGTQISGTTEYYVRYNSDDTFKIFATAQDAITGAPEVTLVNSTTQFWYVFANKRVSPMRFDPTFVDTSASRAPAITDGLWYLNLKDETSNDDNILGRFSESDYDSASGQVQTTDSFYTRLEDKRDKDDRIYRLRYVQPKDFPGAVRKPNNGFVIKIRTDTKRNLLPQRIVLEPIGGAPALAEFRNPDTTNAAEVIGMSVNQFDAAVQAGTLDKDNIYDPDNNPVIVNTDNFLRFSIRSARTVSINSQPLLEVTAFDHTVDDTNAPQLKNTVFHTVEINAPQAGTFTVSKTSSTVSNRVEWTGGSSGFGYIHAYFNVGAKHFIILKDVSARPTYDPLVNTRFDQNGVYADQQADVNGGRDLTSEYLYVVQGANVFTLTPGDTVDDSVGNTYKVLSVEDENDIDDTFYIFDAEEIQERVSGQQDGIYYLTAVRGNVTPLPRGAGVANNFQNFKFSQPISSLYPLDYKNDPTWYQVIDNNGTKDTLIKDPQASSSFADNYTHGLVYVNDYKRSMTKEAVVDLTESAYFEDYTYTGANSIAAQDGNATSGSEQRKIPIAGDTESVHDQKVYVELRRPSIARSGNHTFEYLGFGPGNYSTGLPARQEVILTEFQDYYAQAKRQDGGIVFYTGLNSNGDLYIGNRKIDAITGEEEFLERAVLAESEDDSDPIESLVTSFDTPVTFKDKITVEGISYLNNRVIINTQPPSESPALVIQSNPRNDGGNEDNTLTRGNFANRSDGDITIDRNKISAAIFETKGRGTVSFPGQTYSQRTHYSYSEQIPTNRTPDQSSTFSSDQFVRYYQSTDVDANPQPGDMLLKGNSIQNSGSLGWIYANYYQEIPAGSILDLVTNGSATVRINWSGVLTNADTSIKMSVGKTIRIQGFSQPLINGLWTVTRADQTGADNDFIEFVVANAITGATYTWDPTNQPTAVLERSEESWKEFGVLGSEALRTDTDAIGEYKLGVNTLARTAHAAHEFGFLTYSAGGTTYDQQEPRANLDVVGNAFISGRTITNAQYMAGTGTAKGETNVHEAFLVGGDSASPQSTALFRVDTVNNRVGINLSRSDLSDTLTINGTLKLLGANANVDIDGDLNVDGGDITTNESTFNLLNDNALTVNAFGDATALNIADDATADQTINIGTSSAGLGTLNIHTSLDRSVINIGTTPNNNPTSTSVITIGGGFQNTANSTLTVKNAQTILDGDLDVNGGDIQSNSSTINLFTRSGAGNIVNFASRASQFTLGGVAGTTTIRNSLIVNGDTDMMGDVTMNGGSNSGTVTVTRASLNTSKIAHSAGSLSNLNVDFYEFIADIDGAEIITSVNGSNGQMVVADNYFLDGNTVRFSDTTGLSNNVNTTTTYFVVNSSAANGTLQIAATEGGTPIVFSGTPGTSTGITLQNTLVDTGSGTNAWTGNPSDAEYTRLPVNNVEGIEIGDILIIGTELVEVISPGPDANTRIVPVNRGVDCTTIPTNTADNTVINKLAKSPGATYTVGRVPQNAATPAVSNLNAVADTLEVPIGELQEGDAVSFSSIGSIQGAIVQGTTYFVANVINDTANSVTRFNLAADPGGGALDITGGSTTGAVLNFSDTLIALAEFGGQIKVGDYLRISPSTTCPSGEFVEVITVNSTNAEKFTVNNGANQDRFVIDSVFGGVDSTILGEQDFSINLTAVASTNADDNKFRVINGTGLNPTERFTINAAGTTDFVGDGTTADPNARLRSDGMFWLSNVFRITNGNGGNIDSDSDDLALFFDNSNGNLDVQGHIRLGDNLSVFKDHGTGVGFGSADRVFHVANADGDTTIGETGGAYGEGDLTVNGGHLTLVGTSTTTPSSTDYPLSITNMGESGNRNYRIRRDAAIDAFGVTQFYNKNGGRRWDYINANTTLETGHNYIVAVSADTVLTLPDDAETGDMIRFIEVTGSISYAQSIILRAPTGVAIQGDTTGTNAGGLPSAYQGGELIVQTRNAGFGLVFMGSQDGGGQSIPTTYRGWWLTEI